MLWSITYFDDKATQLWQSQMTLSMFLLLYNLVLNLQNLTQTGTLELKIG